MEQKDYKLEIIKELLKNENHIRSIAKNLNTNHMNIVRKINDLYKENVVDYRREGKNKTYFLKNTIEARAYVFKTEIYKLVQMLKKYPYLRGIIEKIQKNQKVKLAVLFGSYAKGIARPDSDIDVYIDTINKEIKEDIRLIDTRLSVKIGKYDKTNPLIKEIDKNHMIIKGIEQYYERNKIFD